MHASSVAVADLDPGADSGGSVIKLPPRAGSISSKYGYGSGSSSGSLLLIKDLKKFKKKVKYYILYFLRIHYLFDKLCF
jgi:hypothetical protein